MTDQETVKSGEAKPKELRERFLVSKTLDVELFQEGKETVREVFRKLGTGKADRFIHRQKDGEDFFTRIRPGSEEPEESNTNLFDQVWAKEENFRLVIEKYKVESRDYPAIEYTEYIGDFRKFATAEVKFGDEDQANKFNADPPDWIGEPINGIPFDNYSISQNGSPV